MKFGENNHVKKSLFLPTLIRVEWKLWNFLLMSNFWICPILFTQTLYDFPLFQLRFFGFYAWSMIQRICLPLCIFFRFHSSVILVEIWKNSYKTKLMDWSNLYQKNNTTNETKQHQKKIDKKETTQHQYL